MSATDFGALDIARTRSWAGEIWKTFRDQSFWFANGFIGESQADFNRPIHRITELSENGKGGLECVMQLVLDLESDGVAGDNLLAGNEESLQNDAQVIKVDMIRNGVVSKGEMAEQATVVRFRAEAKERLGFWMPNKLDELMFLTGSGRAYTLKTNGAVRGTTQLTQLKFAADVKAASTNRIKYAGAATSEATLTASDKMSWSVIVNARQYAVRNGVRPIRDRGKDYYVMVLSPEQVRDLLLDSTYQTIVSRAAERGSTNPLFTNAIAVVQGVVIYEHRKVFNSLGLASGSKWGAGGLVDGAQALLLGAQALGFATLGNTFWREKTGETDYGNRPGIGVGRKVGILKPQFKSPSNDNAREDFGVVSVKTAAAL
jgi:N4-gp56 family major capsid protein